MQIKKVAVLGAGAVGSYVIWGLSQAENLSLGVIAEGERAGRLKENGCLINGQVYRRRSGHQRKRTAQTF